MKQEQTGFTGQAEISADGGSGGKDQRSEVGDLKSEDTPDEHPRVPSSGATGQARGDPDSTGQGGRKDEGQTKDARRWNIMARVIIEPQSDDNLRDLISLAVENQLRVIDFGIEKTRRKLGQLEKRFGMNTMDFYKDFLNGKLGDDLEYIRWAGEYETLERLQKDHRDLQGIELCS